MPDGANKGSFLQGYNAQAAVDSTAQVIVAAEVTQEANDSRQLLPMLGQVEENLGRKPQAASADAGYWSEANATDESVAGIDPHRIKAIVLASQLLLQLAEHLLLFSTRHNAFDSFAINARRTPVGFYL